MIFSTSPKRTFVEFPITDFSFIKQQMLTWASPFNICCFLDNHAYGLSPHTFECVLAAGAVDAIQADAGNAFQQLKDFASIHRDWLFGHFAYGLTKETEPINGGPATPLPDTIGFPDLYFFLPEILIELNSGRIRIGSFRKDHEAIWQQILQMPPAGEPSAPLHPVFTPRISREEYLATVGRLQQHIFPARPHRSLAGLAGPQSGFSQPFFRILPAGRTFSALRQPRAIFKEDGNDPSLSADQRHISPLPQRSQS